MYREEAQGLAATPRLPLGDFVLDVAQGELLDASGRPAVLRAQSLRVLLTLGERVGQVVGKDELLRRIWGDAVVTDDSLVQAIGDIRRLLGPTGHEVLRTVPRRGYLLSPIQTGALVDPPFPDQPAVPTANQAEATSPADTQETNVPPSRARPHRLTWALAGAALISLLLVLAATLWPRAAPPPTRILAILPLESDDPAAADVWFADAITGDLNAMVARWRGEFQLVGRGTMQTYKGKGTDPRVVGRELGATYVMTGRVRRAGDRVRIAVELVDALNGQVLWARPFEVERGELPGSVGDIAGGIAKALNIEIGDVVTRHLQPLDAVQANADDLAMRGWSLFLKSVGPDSFEHSRRLFEQALARDPRSVRALAGVSLTNSMNVSFSYTTDKEVSMRRSQQALAQLEAIDPTAQLTLVARGSYLLSSADWAGQFAVSEDLIRDFPNDPTSHHTRCSSLLRLGRFEEAIPACDRAIRISPNESRTPIWHALAGMNEYMRGNHAAATARARIAWAANTKIPSFAMLLAASLADGGRREEAQRVMNEFRQLHPSFDSERIRAIWEATNAHPKFVEGRNRLIATVRELGLP